MGFAYFMYFFMLMGTGKAWKTVEGAEKMDTWLLGYISIYQKYLKKAATF